MAFCSAYLAGSRVDPPLDKQLNLSSMASTSPLELTTCTANVTSTRTAFRKAPLSTLWYNGCLISSQRANPKLIPRLRLFDIPSLVFKDGDRPNDSAEANQAARDLIESLLKSEKRLGGKAKDLWAVMSKIALYDSVYVDEEYPVVKPRPVSGHWKARVG